MKQIKDSQQIAVAVKIEDAKGHPVDGAKFDADPVYGVDGPATGSLQVADDKMSATFIPDGVTLGVNKISFSASLNGQAIVAESEEISVVAGDAAKVEMVLSEPADQPPAAQ